jgi:glycosyltransferase involved in cell wall biosynthesis
MAKTRPCLLIALPFPPDGPEGASVRMATFARYLPQSGWTPTILSGASDGPRLPELPGIERLGGTGVAPLAPPGDDSPRWALRQGLRALLVPDPHVRWVPRAVRQGLAWVAANPGAPIVSSGPSHACHLVGLALQRLTGAKWIADFQGRWADDPLRKPFPGTLQWLNRLMEKAVLTKADRILVVSPAHHQALSAIVPAERLVLLTDGFDPADFAKPPAFTPQADLVIRHFGSLARSHGGRGDPRGLQALVTVIKSLATDGRPVRVEVVGSDRVDHPACQSLPPLPHAEAIGLMHQTEVLLLVPGAAAVLPGKLYDFAATGRPILNIGDLDGESARWIAAKRAGVTVAPDDVAGLAAALQSWRQMAQVTATKLSPRTLREYDRRAGARQLASLLASL